MFRGKRLKDDETVQSLELEDGNVLHLIASMEQPREAEPVAESPSPQQAQPTPAGLEDEQISEVAELEILAGVLRTLRR